LAATWRWPTLAQMNHSELSHMAGAVDDSIINIVEVIVIIVINHCDHFVGKVSAMGQPTRPTQPGGLSIKRSCVQFSLTALSSVSLGYTSPRSIIWDKQMAPVLMMV